MLRRLFVMVHRWLGLVVGVHLLLNGLTGLVLVLDEPYEQTFGHRTDHRGTATLVEAVSAMRASTGATQDPAWVKAPAPGSGHDWRLSVDTAEQGAPRKRVVVRVDSGSGEVREVTPSDRTPWGLAFAFHHELFLSGKIGRPIVAVLGALALMLCVLGVVIWWRGGRGPRMAVSLKGLQAPTGRARMLALHELTAIWTVVGLVVSIASGIVLAKPDWFGGALRRQPPTASRVDFARLTKALEGRTFEMVRIAPEREGVAITVVEAQGSFRVDPDVFSMTPAPAPPRTVISTMRTLHEGHYAGALGQLIVSLMGFLPLLLFVTGFIAWRRTRRTIAFDDEARLQAETGNARSSP